MVLWWALDGAAIPTTANETPMTSAAALASERV